MLYPGPTDSDPGCFDFNSVSVTRSISHRISGSYRNPVTENFPVQERVAVLLSCRQGIEPGLNASDRLIQTGPWNRCVGLSFLQVLKTNYKTHGQLLLLDTS